MPRVLPVMTMLCAAMYAPRDPTPILGHGPASMGSAVGPTVR